jgi:hypothetical protein
VADGSGWSGFQAAIEDEVLLASVGNDFDIADNDVVVAVHVGGEGELEFSDAVGAEGELRAADAAGFDGDGFVGGVVGEGVPGVRVGLELKCDAAGFAGVVVDGDRDGDAVALGKGDGEIEVDEEVLEDFEAAGSGAQRAGLGGGEHGHAPSGDGVRDGDGYGGVAVGVGEYLRVDVERLREVGADVWGSRLEGRG